MIGRAALAIALLAWGCAPPGSTPPASPTSAVTASPSPALPSLTIAHATVPNAPDPSALRDVVRAGPGFVAVGDTLSGSLAWTSSDGVAWLATGAPEGTGMAGAVALEDGRIVAVGRDVTLIEEELATAWVSADGSTWTRAEGELEGGQMIDVAAGGPGLVGVGSAVALDAAAVWVSADGTRWERIPHVPAFDKAFMWSVIAGGPGLVAVGWRRAPEPSAAVWTSMDGRDWERSPDPPGADGHQMRTISVFGDTLVAAGDRVEGGQAAVWISEDGRTWERVPHTDSFADASINGLVPAGPWLIALGGNGEDAAMWISDDGISWIPVRHEAFDGAHFTAALHVAGRLIAVGASQERIRGTNSYRQTAAVWKIEVR